MDSERFYYCYKCNGFYSATETSRGLRCSNCGTVGMDLLSVVNDHDDESGRFNYVKKGVYVSISRGVRYGDPEYLEDLRRDAREKYEKAEMLPLNKAGEERRKLLGPEIEEIREAIITKKDAEKRALEEEKARKDKEITDRWAEVERRKKEEKERKEEEARIKAEEEKHRENLSKLKLVLIVILIFAIGAWFAMPKGPSVDDVMHGKASYNELSSTEKKIYDKRVDDARESAIDYLFGTE